MNNTTDKDSPVYPLKREAKKPIPQESTGDLYEILDTIFNAIKEEEVVGPLFRETANSVIGVNNRRRFIVQRGRLAKFLQAKALEQKHSIAYDAVDNFIQTMVFGGDEDKPPTTYFIPNVPTSTNRPAQSLVMVLPHFFPRTKRPSCTTTPKDKKAKGNKKPDPHDILKIKSKISKRKVTNRRKLQQIVSTKKINI